jgi:hypothetical protein
LHALRHDVVREAGAATEAKEGACMKKAKDKAAGEIQGFTLTICERKPDDVKQETPPKFLAELCRKAESTVWLELKFNCPPTQKWKDMTEEILTRMSCNGSGGLYRACASQEPELTRFILADAVKKAKAAQS